MVDRNMVDVIYIDDVCIFVFVIYELALGVLCWLLL